MSSVLTKLMTKQSISDEEMIKALELRIDDIRRLMDSMTQEFLAEAACVPFKPDWPHEVYTVKTAGDVIGHHNVPKDRGVFIPYWGRTLDSIKQSDSQKASSYLIWVRNKQPVTKRFMIEYFEIENLELQSKHPKIELTCHTATVPELIEELGILPSTLWGNLGAAVYSWENKRQKLFEVAQAAANEFRANDSQMNTLSSNKHFI